MGRNKKANVWRHFSIKNGDYECNFCKKVYKSKNVNKLENHLIACLHCPVSIKVQINRNPSQVSTPALTPSSTQPPTQPSNISENQLDNDEDSSNSIISSASANRTSTPHSSRAGTPTSMSMRPVSLFFDRMSDQENVRKKHTFLGYSVQTLFNKS